jgi:hypothetical protein
MFARGPENAEETEGDVDAQGAAGRTPALGTRTSFGAVPQGFVHYHTSSQRSLQRPPTGAEG